MTNFSEDRPSPDKFLAAIHKEENESQKGALKVFIGMAAGVGKTYAMLEEAKQLKKTGVNLLVGVIDTHGRAETDALLEGLEILPEREVLYRDKLFKELDLDLVLKLRPELVLIDELAHSNIPDSKHAKRWQDVEEILDNGIDVYTTLNIQHLESVNDIIEQVTEVKVKETVPDFVVENASALQIVDITPQELLERLKEGKIYFGEQSIFAAKNFFQKARLMALREILLRYTAERVDRDIEGNKESSLSNLNLAEKLMVAVSHCSSSQKLIRITRRMAFKLGVGWVTVHVDDGTVLSEKENNNLAKNLGLARDLGAEVITTHDSDIAAGLCRLSILKGVSQIIVGRPTQKGFLKYFSQKNIVNRLLDKCPSLDITVVKQESKVFNFKSHMEAFYPTTKPYQLFIILLIVIAMSLVNWALMPYIGGYKGAGSLFLIGLLVLSLYFKKEAIFLASFMIAIIYGIIFIPPEGEFSVGQFQDLALLGIYLTTAVVTGMLVDRSRHNQDILVKREAFVQALYNIVKQIATAPSIPILVKSIIVTLESFLYGKFEILTLDDLDKLDEFSLLTTEKERTAALWVLTNGIEAGWSTSTLPSSLNLYIPLKGYVKVVGVLIYHPEINRSLTVEEKNFLFTVAQQLSNYLEKIEIEKNQIAQQEKIKSQKMFQKGMEAMSEEMIKPFDAMQKAIFLAIETIQKNKNNEDFAVPISHIEESSQRFLHIYENLNALAEVSPDTILNLKNVSLKLLIDESIKKIAKFFESRNIHNQLKENFDITADSRLISLLIENIILNAIQNSTYGSELSINAEKKGNKIKVEFSSPAKQSTQNAHVPELTQSLPQTKDGFGITVSKEIARLHKGELVVEISPGKDVKFTLTLPIS